MKEQQERARAARADVSAKVATPDTTKLDQSKLIKRPVGHQSSIVMIGKGGVEVDAAQAGEEVTIIVDNNPFHAEAAASSAIRVFWPAKKGRFRLPMQSTSEWLSIPHRHRR